jgi:hypothetical protein
MKKLPLAAKKLTGAGALPAGGQAWALQKIRGMVWFCNVFSV